MKDGDDDLYTLPYHPPSMKRFKLTSNPSTIKSESLLRSKRSSSSSSSSIASSIRCFASQPRRTRPGASATDSTDLGRHFYLNKVLEQWAARPATRMTLRQLVFFGKTLGRDRDKILKVRDRDKMMEIQEVILQARSILIWIWKYFQSIRYIRTKVRAIVQDGRIRELSLRSLPAVNLPLGRSFSFFNQRECMPSLDVSYAFLWNNLTLSIL